METGHTYHPVRSQCGRHAPHFGAHGTQYTTPSKIKFSHTARPVHGATSVGASSRRRRARRPRHLRARAARCTGHHHRRPDPATRHEPRCELSRSCECAAQWWAAVGASARPTERRSAARRPRALPESCSQLPPHRLAGSMGRGGSAEARAPARSVPQLAFHQPAPFARFVASEVIGLSVELVRRRSCGAPHGSLRDRRVGRRNEGASRARVRLGEGSGVETPAPQAHHAPPDAKVGSPPLAKPLGGGR